LLLLGPCLNFEVEFTSSNFGCRESFPRPCANRSDADSLSNLLTRQLALDKQFQAMQGPWYIRFLQVVLAADPDIRKETWNGYSYQILLTPEAMIWGMSGALLLSFGIECLFRLIDWVVLGGKRLRQSRPIVDRDVRGL